MAVKLFVLTVTPLIAAFTYWWWYVGNRGGDSGWRRSMLKWAVVAVTANVVLFYFWLVVRLMAGPLDWVWTVQNVCRVGAEYSDMFAMAGSILGKGSGRIAVFVLVIFSLVLWAPIGIL